MKKRFFLMALMSMFTALVFTSCVVGEEDEDDGTPDSLRGTSWVRSYEIRNDVMTETLEFAAAIDFVVYKATSKSGENDEAQQGYAYTYSKPNLTITMNGRETKFVVEADKMTYGLGGDEEQVFTKQ